MSPRPPATRRGCDCPSRGAKPAAWRIADGSAGASLVISGIGLSIVPKCPLCLAGWGAAMAGLGWTLQDLMLIRPTAWWICGLAAIYLTLRGRRRLRPNP